jgi:cytochrome d ubiquinol oxidase subunit I
MEHLLAARAQMGTSLVFHFVFAALGVGMPLFAVIIEGLWLRTGDRAYYVLARTWSKALAALFAIGAVSGTIIAFELGLLWPEFMRYAGAIIGIPFSAEGFAFFIEAIFVGIYLYGWDRLSPLAHWLCGWPIVISGAASAVAVMSANAWMNAPTGFRVVGGAVVDVHPWVAVRNAAAQTQVLHTLIACYLFTAFLVASIYALKSLKGDLYAHRALRVGMIAALLLAPAQILVGDFSAKFDARAEPEKLAAMEGQFATERGAPLHIGGIPDSAQHRTLFSIEVPKALSWLAFGDANATVRGLDSFPQDRIPNALFVHLAFEVMVGLGSLLALVAAWWAIATRLGRDVGSRWLRWAIVAMGPAALVAMEAGWLVTEEGRQPWLVRNFFLVSQGVTHAQGLNATFAGFTVLYVVLAVMLQWLLIRIDRAPIDDADAT